ncbi:MAG: DUF956 family protein [Atopobiaceae bacterium]|jgi:hypothetical protein
MAVSQNTSVELTIKATSFMGLTTYGSLLVGDKAVEFYNERNTEDFIQIPWDEIDYVAASVMFGGRYISRFAIFTKKNGHFSFSTRDNKLTLRTFRNHMPADRLQKSPTLLQVMRLGIKRLFLGAD